MHISIIPDGEEIANCFPLIRCEGCKEGCTGNYESYHCPICPEDRFKPTRKGKLLQHLQCHFSGERGYVVSNGYRITTCRQRCGYVDSARSHFHCPFCGRTITKKKIFEDHISECQTLSTQTPLKKEQSSGLTLSQPSDVSLSELSETPLSGNKDDNDESSEYRGIIPKHISAIFDGQNVEDVFHVERCRGCDRGCTGNYVSYHCPICPSERFKATRKEKLINHLNLHFYGDKGFIAANGYRITICHHTCGYGESNDSRIRGHFHCPICTRTFKSKMPAISHVKSCTSAPVEKQAKKSWSKEVVLSIFPSVESKNLLSSGFAIGSDDDEWNLYPEGGTTKSSGLHISIIRDGQRVEDIFSLKRCRGCDKECSGDNSSYHCPICPTEKFNPTTKVKVMSHLHHHFSGSKDYVVTHGYRITTCHNSCGYKRNSRSHFHCPFCLRTVNGKNFFETHIEDCSPPGEDCSPPGVPRKSPENSRMSGSGLMSMTTGTPGPEESTESQFSTTKEGNDEQSAATPCKSESVCQSALNPLDTTKSQSFTIMKENDEQIESQDCYNREGYCHHISIIPDGHSVADYFSVERCQGCDAGCNGGLGCHHCPICPPKKFRPTKKHKVLKHLRRHFTEEKCCIVTSGYRVTICQNNCASIGSKKFLPHLHCPFCGLTFKNRDVFVLHTCTCRTATPQTHPTSDGALSRQQSGASFSEPRKRTIECKECHKKYHPKYIREHERKIHNIEKEYVYVNSQTLSQQVESDPSVKTNSSSPTPTKAINAQSPLEDFYSDNEKGNLPLTDFSDPEEQLNGTEVCQQKSNSALINLISAKLLPISFVEGPEIRDFARSLNPNYNVPTCETTRKLLHGQCDFLHSRVEELIMSTESLCLTVDLWSNRQNKSYIAITGHMIIDFHLHSVLLGWKCVRGKYSTEKIFHYYENTIFDYNIGNKIVTIITDNAPNLFKAFHLPGFENAMAEEFEDYSDDLESESNWFVNGNSDIMEYLPEHERCFLHSLQLVVKDALQTATYGTSALCKVPALASYVRKITENVEDQPALQYAVSAHWSKQLKVIRSVLAIPEEEMVVFDSISGLTTKERLSLQEFVDILTLFEAAISNVQKQDEVTASYVIPVIRNLRHSLKRISATNNSSLKKACLTSLDNHMEVLEKKAIYRRAAVLDPRFKLSWCSEEEAEELRSDLMTLMPKLKNAEASGPSCSPPRKRICLFSFMNELSNAKVRSSEVETYLDEECLPSSADPLVYWNDNAHRLPSLARHAQRYLSVPASSTPLESILSIDGKIGLPSHVKMADAEFEMMMYTKCNSHLL